MPHALYPTDFAAICKEDAGTQWEPSNGTEGHAFIESWCGECERDKEMNGTCFAAGREPTDDDWCPILAASFRGEAKEWQYDKEGQPCCTAFLSIGGKERCPHTLELPLDAAPAESSGPAGMEVKLP